MAQPTEAQRERMKHIFQAALKAIGAPARGIRQASRGPWDFMIEMSHLDGLGSLVCVSARRRGAGERWRAYFDLNSDEPTSLWRLGSERECARDYRPSRDDRRTAFETP